jgi:hypothetical protein
MRWAVSGSLIAPNAAVESSRGGERAGARWLAQTQRLAAPPQVSVGYGRIQPPEPPGLCLPSKQNRSIEPFVQVRQEKKSSG